MTNRRSILFIIDNPGGGGDRPPLVALACRLKNRGHQVTVLCSSATQKILQHTDLATCLIPDQHTQSVFFTSDMVLRWVEDFRANNRQIDDNITNPLEDWAKFVFPAIKLQVSELKPDLIVCSLFGMGLAETLSTHLGVPWCFLNPSFYFGDKSTYAPSRWEKDWYGEVTILFVKYCLLPLSQRAHIVLHATDPIFDMQEKQLPPNHHHVGFLFWEPLSDLPDFITQQGDPWVLLTMSSVPQPDEYTMARAALDALANQPVRVLLTLSEKHSIEKLGLIPKNVTISGFVPHTPVLKCCKMVVSHAGHGIVSKALFNGVPMLLLPWDRDQPGVASRAENLGVAYVVPRANVCVETVHQAVKSVLNDSTYRQKAGQVSARLKTTDELDNASQLLEVF